MKFSLLLIALVAISLVGQQAVKAEVDDYVEENDVTEDEPEQADGEVNDASEEAVQDEPISEPDENDDNASRDEPQDDSEVDDYEYEEEEEVTDEPAEEVDETEEPRVLEEEDEEFEEILAAADQEDSSSIEDARREKRAAVKVNKRCQGAPGVGNCKKKITRYHYDAQKNKCEPFQWSGCGAQPNNWASLPNCEKTCVKLPPAHPLPSTKWDNPIRCTGEAIPGPCKKNIKRYHYNAATNTCEEFKYSGCGGNDNNWVYRNNCVKVCVKKPQPKPKQPLLKWNDKKRCQGPIVVGKCKKSIRRYHYNAAKNVCEWFTWSGCDNTPNNWVYVKNCQKVCVTKKPAPKVKWNDKKRCVGPVVRGTCNKNIRRYHYNAATDKCEPFSYGGCNGNLNNWGYLKNCNSVCVKNKPKPPAKLKWDDERRCLGRAEPGDCKKKIQRFYYDQERDQCLPFTYTGCQGNDNNWWYRKNCQKICLRKKLAWNNPDRCKGPEIRGPCTKNVRRYHYDSALDQCVPFSYGGCGGNDNNWWYKKNCEKICLKDQSKPKPYKPKWNDPVRCKGPIVVGTCKKSIRRFHYDAATNKCVPFTYSGCGGNNNNWWYLNNCKKVCVQIDTDQPLGDGTGDGTGGQGTGQGEGTGEDKGDGDLTGSGEGVEPDDSEDLPFEPTQPDGGYGGITFIREPTTCRGDDGTVEVKVPNPCALVACTKRCQHGFQSDSAGCPTCHCSQPPCQQPN